jgi:glutathione S-transferase
MKLRYSPASPYVRKCLVLAHEAGLAGRIETVPTATADPASGLAKDNPLGKIPALILKDGQVLFDSPVICEYLDSLHRRPKLIPARGKAHPRRLAAAPLRGTAAGQRTLGDLGREAEDHRGARPRLARERDQGSRQAKR